MITNVQKLNKQINSKITNSYKSSNDIHIPYAYTIKSAINNYNKNIYEYTKFSYTLWRYFNSFYAVYLCSQKCFLHKFS